MFAVLLYTLVLHTVSAKHRHRNSTNWAVLVAGSNNYLNYRHQADVSHAYKILTKLGGYPKDKIIVMMYDDVVNSAENPFPGRLFNEPGGVDVYDDIIVSYSGEQVTAENFLNVLKGIKKNDTSNGPVLESGENDNVFVYYADHGATGLVAMPNGAPLYANDLNDTFQYMYAHGMYSQLVFYLEACEAGSMFDAVLSNEISVFATTAASPSQPSYAYYYNDTLATFMADEYSIRWMQDTKNQWANSESLVKQYENVANIVKESQPQQYGSVAFDDEPIEYFEAYQDRPKNDRNKSAAAEWIPSRRAVSSRDVKLAVLQNRYLSEKDPVKKAYAQNLVKEEIEYRESIDLTFDMLIKYVSRYMNQQNISAIKYDYIRPTNYDCLKYVYSKYEDYCERFTDYSLKYVHVLVNLCEVIDDPYFVEFALHDICI